MAKRRRCLFPAKTRGVEVTMNKTFRWCPHGCGKKVECSFNSHGNEDKKSYRCRSCLRTFTKEELDNYWKKEEVIVELKGSIY